MAVRTWWLVALGMAALGSGCGGGNGSPYSDPQDAAATADRRLTDLMTSVGSAIGTRNLHMLAHLHGTENRPSPQDLSAQLTHAMGPTDHYPHVLAIDLSNTDRTTVTIGTTPDANDPDHRTLTVTVQRGTEAGHYIVKAIEFVEDAP